MPIKPELCYFYPIDWPQISHWVRFVRAKGHCQVCGRPHGETVQHLGDGRWWDETEQIWRDGKGRKAPSPALLEDTPVLTTKVMLAAAHNRDLTFAQRAGLGTAFIPRMTELGPDQTKDLAAEGDWDLVCASILDLSSRFANA